MVGLSESKDALTKDDLASLMSLSMIDVEVGGSVTDAGRYLSRSRSASADYYCSLNIGLTTDL